MIQSPSEDPLRVVGHLCAQAQMMRRLAGAINPIVRRTTPLLAPRSTAPALCRAPLRSMSDSVRITFVEADEEIVVDAEIGKTILEVAHANDIDLEGACDGTLACSTCHIVLEQDMYDALPAPDEEEEDMLDLAFDLQDTSRLGCQITVTKELDGMIARVPAPN